MRQFKIEKKVNMRKKPSKDREHWYRKYCNHEFKYFTDTKGIDKKWCKKCGLVESKINVYERIVMEQTAPVKGKYRKKYPDTRKNNTVGQ